MPLNEQMLRELAQTDVEELVELLGLTSEDLIKAFPDQVEAYLEEYRMVDLELNQMDDDGGVPWDEDDDTYTGTDEDPDDV